MTARLVEKLDENLYHADPALSASGAKRLLPPSCPARFKYERDNGGRPNKRAFDVGHAAHKEVLGVGLDVVIVHKTTRDRQSVPAEDYQTKSAQEHRDAIYAEGKVPLLHWELRQVQEMAKALREHPRASALLDPEHGKPEVSVFWHDDKHGINRRSRFDWLTTPTGNGRLIVPDYKTTSSAEPRRFARSIFDFGYDVQRVFYTDAIHAAELAEDVEFLFIAQETVAPYLITVHELDEIGLRLGRERVDRACELFAECTATGIWPGYSDDIELVTPPLWLTDEYGMELI